MSFAFLRFSFKDLFIGAGFGIGIGLVAHPAIIKINNKIIHFIMLVNIKLNYLKILLDQ